MPAASARAGTRASAFTKASAATMACSPTSALSLTTLFMPMSAPQRTTHPCRMAPWPTVTSGPTTVSLPGKPCSMQWSLDVGARLDHDAAEVASKARAGADIGARPDDDVADQDGARMHEGARIDDGDDAVDGIDLGHGKVNLHS